MFKELGPLLRQRTVVMILTRLEDDTVRVNVILCAERGPP